MSNPDLKKFLEECKDAYYRGRPIISDEQYDSLEEALNEEEITIGTNRGKTRHWFRMYSLQKKYIDDNLESIDWNLYIETPKLDGAAIALRYTYGKLDSIVTRGNGEYGELVTNLFSDEKLVNMNIPKELEDKLTGQITGEIVAPKIIPNARNYAAGALGLKDKEEFYKKEINFFPYDIQDNYKYKEYKVKLHTLYVFGFNSLILNTDISQYPSDGKVFRLNDERYFKKLGFTNKHPRGAFALKTRAEGIKTQILDVVWETGKSGKVTPVAILNPVDIDGATVSRATLNNPGFIEALDLHIGDNVLVERAGGIIPRIIKKAE